MDVVARSSSAKTILALSASHGTVESMPNEPDPTATPTVVLTEYVLALSEEHGILVTSHRTSRALVAGLTAYRDGCTLGEATLVARARLLTGVPPGPTANPSTGRTVLVVEDEADVMLAFRIMLETAGYGVMEASSGEQALEKLDHALPDAIVLDILLPGIDGWEVLERLRQSDRARDVPVIVATASASPEYARTAVDLRCDALLTKPFGAEEFRRTVDQLVDQLAQGSE